MRRKNVDHIKNALRNGLSIIAFLVTTDVSYAQFKDVQAQLNNCKDDENGLKGICIGLIAGVSSVMLLNVGLLKGATTSDGIALPAMCPTGRPPSYGAMIQAFVNWAEVHPEEWDTSADIGIIFALQEKWPCK